MLPIHVNETSIHIYNLSSKMKQFFVGFGPLWNENSIRGVYISPKLKRLTIDEVVKIQHNWYWATHEKSNEKLCI